MKEQSHRILHTCQSSTMRAKQTSQQCCNNKTQPKLVVKMYERKRQKINVQTKEVQFRLIDNLMDHYYWRMFVHLFKFKAQVRLEDIILKYAHNSDDLPATAVKLIKSALPGTCKNTYRSSLSTKTLKLVLHKIQRIVHYGHFLNSYHPGVQLSQYKFSKASTESSQP